jgi:hypothetical protein
MNLALVGLRPHEPVSEFFPKRIVQKLSKIEYNLLIDGIVSYSYLPIKRKKKKRKILRGPRWLTLSMA